MEQSFSIRVFRVYREHSNFAKLNRNFNFDSRRIEDSGFEECNQLVLFGNVWLRGKVAETRTQGRLFKGGGDAPMVISARRHIAD